MKAISNAGPLIALAKLGQLGLLLKLFDEIVMPRETIKASPSLVSSQDISPL